MCKYRVRYFNSKRALLVLVWTLLVTIALATIINNISSFAASCDKIEQYNTPAWIVVIPFALSLLGSVFSGWLADAKWGNYRVMKYSIITLFITSIGISIVTLLPCSVFNEYIIAVLASLVGSAVVIAAVAFLVAALQLGLDQMPDASSSSITSFIVWYVFCASTAGWINDVDSTRKKCLNIMFSVWPTQLGSLISPICMTVVLVLDFVLAQKWLIIEPKSPQSFKTIYQVLKFAWKHKSPLNRSALTYWEEDIPSRMDLGKSRYGGPFTTEQVEDVKTVLQLIPLCLTLWLLEGVLAVFLSNHVLNSEVEIETNECMNRLLQVFTYNSWWCGMVWTVLYEFVIYPVIRNKLPSILKRIGILIFLVTTCSIAILILRVLFHYNKNYAGLHYADVILHSIFQGLLMIQLVNTMFEFVCAQAPYNMRGKFGGWIVFILVFFATIQNAIPHSLVVYGIGTGLSLLVFAFYCLLARWYKMRVRDEEYCTQRVVEEVYDRYLSTNS